MRGLLWLLTLAALAVGLSLAARYNAGYALLVLPPWRIELSLNLLLLLLAAGFLLGYLLLRVLVNAYRLPAKVDAFRRQRAQDKATNQLREAMLMLQEGRFARATKSAELAWNSGFGGSLAALTGLAAAHALRDATQLAAWRARARRCDAESGTARRMLEAELALDDRDYATARDLLAELNDGSGKHIAALRLGLRCQQGLGNWREVLRIARQLEKHRALTAEQAAPLRHRVYRELLTNLTDAAQIMRFWNEMPEADRIDSRLAQYAVTQLIDVGACHEAAALIEESLDRQWDSALIALYAECGGGDTLARIAHAETWLASHPRDEQLLLALGRLCQQRQLWGKAQSYLEASLAIRPTRAAHIELAQLFDHLERGGEADRHFRRAAVL
jgi:HemY protein